ncbi:MAG: hypothetical protein HY243_12030 [Proteobacteria bacterium]|nr:hypothetical protein [Pseudomonadota bacterium]
MMLAHRVAWVSETVRLSDMTGASGIICAPRNCCTPVSERNRTIDRMTGCGLRRDESKVRDMIERLKWLPAATVIATGLVGGVCTSLASNHLDAPSVIANPQADIGDVYAWTATDGRHLNLVMTIVGHSFSDRLQYVFHIDSGKQFGKTIATTTIVCRFQSSTAVDCRAGRADEARGDPSGLDGLYGRNHRFRVFAGLRADPFFNNVRGTRAAYQTAAAALTNGTAADSAGCPVFSRAASQAIMDQWQHTDGGPATNFLAGWSASALVISVDLDLVNKGGKLLAIWGATVAPDRQLNREGRPLTQQALLRPLTRDDASDRLKEQYAAASPATSKQFVPEIEKSLALYDGFDGKCGNQLFADPEASPSIRYHRLATLLVDDRLWVNSASSVCTQLFAVELANLGGQTALRWDCGGRTIDYNTSNVYRSRLVDGTNTSVDDGVERADRPTSVTAFPFLAAPGPSVAPKY